jgi:N-acyl-D-amino-acid deacylase
VRRVLRYSHTMIGSDGLPDDPLPHPRLWGTFPRVLGRYSRELGLFPLPEAVRKMTGLSAERFGLRQRGRIREGYFADLVLFDPQTVADRATFGTPKVPAAGIELVMVNGVIALQDGRLTGRCAGRFLPREAGEGDQGASS